MPLDGITLKFGLNCDISTTASLRWLTQVALTPVQMTFFVRCCTPVCKNPFDAVHQVVPLCITFLPSVQSSEHMACAIAAVELR